MSESLEESGTAPGPPAEERADLLVVEGIGVGFGGVTALRDLSFSVAEGTVHALIGPNGAGKTTAFNCITRTQRPQSGQIRYRDLSLLRVPPARLPKLGIMRTFQHPQLCPSLTVIENVLLGHHSRTEVGWLPWITRSPGARREERAATEEGYEILRALDLADLAEHEADRLPYAALKRVELARALMGRPRLLLLDEPAAGLTTEDVERFGDTLLRLNREQGITILVIEHNLTFVGRLADTVTVLVDGHVVAEGTLAEVREIPIVREAFLGKVRG
ncbi:ABC transporter ATP-binding protein [Actinomadura sp. NBRC 104412]|uniref:ABC transporter ATP-binding protein n=1 Tax=Actinomadura sp. NBRC 104412 TaxID=3032203 RepID=UPI002557927E|nr:ABC transporter ATP-binding protein [Actinomadura sp. NBRC 104412]